MERDFWELLLMVWVIHLIVSGVLSVPIIFFGRKRVDWRAWELLVFVLPFSAWAFLMVGTDLPVGRKSLSNFGEPAYFALAIPIAATIRVIMGRRFSEVIVSILLIGGVCGLAVGVFFLMPALPE